MKRMFSAKSRHDIKRIIAYFVMFIVGALVLMFVSRETGYYLQNDSKTYLDLGNKHGVMPLYPLFLYGMKVIFGSESFLMWVVYFQTIAAIGASLFVVAYLEKVFELNYLECSICYIALLLLFNIDYVYAGISHQILTEGLVYPIFYIYFVYLARSIWEKWFTNTIIHVALACLLSLIRSQMKMIIVLSVAVAMYYWIKQCVVEKKAKHIVSAVVSAVVVGVVAFAICAGCDIVLQNVTGQIIRKQSMEMVHPEEISNDDVTQKVAIDKDAPVEHSIAQAFDLFDGKILYTAQESDIELFTNEDIRLVYSIVYHAMDENECLYKYSQSGLNKWRSMLAFNNCASVARAAYDEYVMSHSELSEDFIAYEKAINQITMSLFKQHWGDMIKHMGVFYFHGVMCGVCFENEEHIVLCYIVTALSYFMALITVMLRLGQKKSDKKDVELFILAIVLSHILNAMVSIPLFTIRRYVCYFIGIYYAMLFICIRNWAVSAGIIKRK